MNKTNYTRLRVDIVTSEEEIGPHEKLRRSDELYQIERDLNKWLGKRLALTSFVHHIRVS